MHPSHKYAAPGPRAYEASSRPKESQCCGALSPDMPFVREPTQSHRARRKKMESILHAVAAGDTATVLSEAIRLHKASPQEPLFAIEIARQFHATGHTAESMQILQQVVSGMEHSMALGMLGFCHVEQGEFSLALELFGRALQKNPTDAFTRINMQAIKDKLLPAGKVKPVQAFPAVTIATSLPPKDMEASRRAVTSWLQYGFRVISVNTETEYGDLKAHFPNVHFCIQQHTARELTGKDHQYLDSLLDALAAGPDGVCAIVNADIILQGSKETWEGIAAEAERNFVFGSRVNVAGPDDRQGRIYAIGFDWFFFPKSFLSAVPRSQFAIGQPFWDYCFPAWAAANDLPLRYCHSPVALHILHPQTWNHETCIRFTLHGLDLLTASFISLVSRTSGLHADVIFALSDALWLGIRETASPLFCRDPLFKNHMAPLDPVFWQTDTEEILTTW